MHDVAGKCFESDILGCPGIVVVDFWATWCSPCKALRQTLDRLSQKYSGRVKFSAVCIDEEPDLANAYSISSVPTLIAFKDGVMIGKEVGVVQASEVEGLFKMAL